MQRNVLELYLTKVSSGDKQYLDKLYQRLAERLLWVPVSVVEELTRNGDPVQRCELVTISVGGSPLLPAFTSEQKLRDWVKINRIRASTLSMMGRDLCAQLDVDLGLLINDRSQNCVELNADQVKTISEVKAAEHVGDDFGDELGAAEMEAADRGASARSGAPMDMSSRTVEIVVDLKKVQDLVRQQILEQAAVSASDTEQRRVITLYDVVSEKSEK